MQDFENYGYWYVWSGDHYIGAIQATSEKWEEMGCDLYPRLYEAELIPDIDQMEAAEADTDQSICLIYKNSDKGYLVQFSEKNIQDDMIIGFLNDDHELCSRHMNFHGKGSYKNGWQCRNDHTGCMYNKYDPMNGHNTCIHPDRLSDSPLEDEKK